MNCLQKIETLIGQMKGMNINRIRQQSTENKNIPNICYVDFISSIQQSQTSNEVRQAYKQLNQQYLMQIGVRGDGNCFYRSLMLSYILQLASHECTEELEKFIQSILNITNIELDFSTHIIHTEDLQLLLMIFLMKILTWRREQIQVDVKMILAEYNSLPEVDFAACAIARFMIYQTFEKYQDHPELQAFVDQEIKDHIPKILLRQREYAEGIIIPLAAQAFQCQLVIQNLYSEKGNLEKLNSDQVQYKPLINQQGNTTNQTQVHLLFSADHYDCLLSNQLHSQNSLFYKIPQIKFSNNNQNTNSFINFLLLQKFKYQRKQTTSQISQNNETSITNPASRHNSLIISQSNHFDFIIPFQQSQSSISFSNYESNFNDFIPNDSNKNNADNSQSSQSTSSIPLTESAFMLSSSHKNTKPSFKPSIQITPSQNNQSSLLIVDEDSDNEEEELNTLIFNDDDDEEEDDEEEQVSNLRTSNITTKAGTLNTSQSIQLNNSQQSTKIEYDRKKCIQCKQPFTSVKYLLTCNTQVVLICADCIEILLFEFKEDQKSVRIEGLEYKFGDSILAKIQHKYKNLNNPKHKNKKSVSFDQNAIALKEQKQQLQKNSTAKYTLQKCGQCSKCNTEYFIVKVQKQGGSEESQYVCIECAPIFVLYYEHPSNIVKFGGHTYKISEHFSKFLQGEKQSQIKDQKDMIYNYQFEAFSASYTVKAKN